jgi:hypothetical protein
MKEQPTEGTTKGKGTTSVVPLKSSIHAALAAEVRFSG